MISCYSVLECEWTWTWIIWDPTVSLVSSWIDNGSKCIPFSIKLMNYESICLQSSTVIAGEWSILVEVIEKKPSPRVSIKLKRRSLWVTFASIVLTPVTLLSTLTLSLPTYHSLNKNNWSKLDSPYFWPVVGQ